MSRFSFFLLVSASFSAAIGQILFKIGADGKEKFIEFINIPIMLGLLLYAFGTIVWIYVLSYEQLVNVYAFTVLTFAIVYIGSIFIMGEKITTIPLIGIIFILSGLYLIANNNH